MKINLQEGMFMKKGNALLCKYYERAFGFSFDASFTSVYFNDLNYIEI